MIQLTVFTPAYNRAHTLPRLYQSLKKQSDLRFLWLIVDDGSTDNTASLAEDFRQNDNNFEIRYVKNAHGGIHTAYNTAIGLCDTPYIMCVDSDDWLTDTAVGDILDFLHANADEKAAGAAALNMGTDGKILGGELPDIKKAHIFELQYKYAHKGDIKMIYKTQALKSVAPMPGFPGEESFNPFWLFVKADKTLPLLVLNKPVCVVDYSTNGMHTRVFYDYMHSPRSFAELRRTVMSAQHVPLRIKYRTAIHYVSSCIFAGERRFIRLSPLKLLTFFAVIPGVILNIYVRIKNKERH